MLYQLKRRSSHLWGSKDKLQATENKNTILTNSKTSVRKSNCCTTQLKEITCSTYCIIRQDLHPGLGFIVL